MQFDLKPWSTALGIGFAGAALAAVAGVPAGALIGSTLAVSAVAAAGLKVSLPPGLRDLAFAAIGVSLGSGIDQQIFEQIGAWGLSLAVLIASLVAIVLTGLLVLNRLFGLDSGTGVLASSPGTMSNAIAMAVEGHGDGKAVMVLQLMRVLFLMVIVPPLAVQIDPPGPATLAAPATIMGGIEIAVLLALSLAVGLLALRNRFPAACLVSGMLVSAAAHAAGLVHGAAPDWLLFAALAVTGTVFGTRISGINLKEAAHLALAGVASVLTALVVSFAFALLTVWLTDLPFGQVWIAYAPGGVEAMAAIGLALGYDPAFVAVHHFARIFSLVLLVPFILRLVTKKKTG